jgi:hypothetical protein
MNATAQKAAPLTPALENAVLQSAISVAMRHANEKFEAEKKENKVETKQEQPANVASNVSPISAAKMKSIVVRKDILGSVVVFDVDSHVKREDGEFIDYWDGKSTKVAPVDYYRKSTRPVEMDEAKKVMEQYMKANKLQQAHLRSRLEKNRFESESQGKAETVDINAFLDKLQDALIKTISSMRV